MRYYGGKKSSAKDVNLLTNNSIHYNVVIKKLLNLQGPSEGAGDGGARRRLRDAAAGLAGTGEPWTGMYG
jgi:hypothetical protein